VITSTEYADSPGEHYPPSPPPSSLLSVPILHLHRITEYRSAVVLRYEESSHQGLRPLLRLCRRTNLRSCTNPSEQDRWSPLLCAPDPSHLMTALSHSLTPGHYTGTGDCTAALLLAWIHKTQENISTALLNTLSSIQSILLLTQQIQQHHVRLFPASLFLSVPFSSSCTLCAAVLLTHPPLSHASVGSPR
jgi:hypothetical protein